MDFQRKNGQTVPSLTVPIIGATEYRYAFCKGILKCDAALF